MQWLSFSTGLTEVVCVLMIIVIQSMIVALVIYYICRILVTTCNCYITMTIVFGVVALYIMQYEIRV